MKRFSAATWMTIAALSMAATIPAYARPARTAGGAKYVFFFLGDGLSASQIQATEAYLTTINGGSARNPADLLKPENRLNMSKLPVQGMQTTFDDGALMTDSASSATAFACGIKTKSGVIGKNTAKTVSYKSVAQLAHERGKSVGVLTSVSLDHATPAAYYASVDSRSQMNSICMQLANSGYAFFGGGGLAQPTGSVGNAWSALAANGYSVVSNRADILALRTSPASKVVCINPWLQDAAAMPYEIDRVNQPMGVDNVSLKEMTEVAIDCLSSDPDGFFIMVEGGKIDWACHANDAVATFGDVLDFDAAVGVAAAFCAAHPADTLLIVTGDHETGGMTVGHATTGYTEAYTNLLGQTCSFQQFGATDWVQHKAAYTNGYDWTKNNLESGDADAVAFTNLVAARFGLQYASLNTYQREKLEDSYDFSMAKTNNNSVAENTWMYGGYEATVVSITHILNERASIGWTSYSHTGVPVPVFAAGFDGHRFEGFYDNTDIAKQIGLAMRLPVALPVVK